MKYIYIKNINYGFFSDIYIYLKSRLILLNIKKFRGVGSFYIYLFLERK